MAFELPPLPYAHDALEPTSTRAPWRSTMASTIRHTSTTRTRRSPAPTGRMPTSSRWSAASLTYRKTSADRCATTRAATPITRSSAGHAPGAGGAPSGALGDAISSTFSDLDTSRNSSPRRRHAVWQRLGLAREERWRPRDHLDAKPGQPTHRREDTAARTRCGGSTPTTSTTRTGAPTTSARGGTSSTGTRWPAASPPP